MSDGKYAINPIGEGWLFRALDNGGQVRLAQVEARKDDKCELGWYVHLTSPDDGYVTEFLVSDQAMDTLATFYKLLTDPGFAMPEWLVNGEGALAKDDSNEPV